MFWAFFTVFIPTLMSIVMPFILLAIAIYVFVKQLKANRQTDILRDKKRLIKDLVGYRYILSEGFKPSLQEIERFNSTLNSIPAYFSENEACMDKYRSIGYDFTPATYKELILLLAEDAGLNFYNIDLETFNNIPHYNATNKNT